MKAAHLQICLKCDNPFFGIDCPKCGSRYYRTASEDDYRGFLERITGKRSCKDMSALELMKLNGELLKIGWQKRIDEERDKAKEAKRRTKNYIQAEAERIFGAEARSRVEGFCLKVIGKSFSRLNDLELRRVIGWIHRTEKHSKKDQ